MTLSILICSLHKRTGMLVLLLQELYRQIELLNVSGQVEILVEFDNMDLPTGTKRNILYQKAKGRYSISVDDDDWIPEYYIEELLKAAAKDVDCFAINGVITVNGINEKKWYISKELPYITSKDEYGNEIFLRYPNHITAIRSNIAKRFKFPDKTIAEDYDWATQIHKSGLIKTEYIIEKPMYYYKFIHK